MKAALLVVAIGLLGAVAILWILTRERPSSDLAPSMPPAPQPVEEEPAVPPALPGSERDEPAVTLVQPPAPLPPPSPTPAPDETPRTHTVADRLVQFGGGARARWRPAFEANNLAYPPRKVAFIGLKDERMLEVWAAADDGRWCHMRDYPILGMSGTLGPKLREGDLQAPEGIYSIESLNPNSAYHLSLRINYPNTHDRRRGAHDRRENLGSDIMIHGRDVSIGCLAMGDQAAEDLFVLAAETGPRNISVILSPVDFRTRGLPAEMPPVPPWTGELYDQIRAALGAFETQGEPSRP